MVQDYHHGVRVIEINEGTRPIRTVETAVIGLVATANDADIDFFPLNQPVLITDIFAAISNAGATGTLLKSLTAIKAETNPLMVVVRVNADSDDDITTSNVIGTVENNIKTGLQAFYSCKTKLGVKPRILVAPGLDNLAVATELASIAGKTRSFAYINIHGANNITEAYEYRKNFASREIMFIWPESEIWDNKKSARTDSFLTATAAGLRAKLDDEIGWHKTISNIPINGIIGINKDISFDLQSPNTDAGYLNAHEITTIINEGGYRFWGSRTCSDDPLFAFENYTRTAQILADTIAEAHRHFVDRPVNKTLIRDILDSINAKFRQLVSQGYLIGAEAWFDPKLNDKTALKAGKLYIDYDYTPVPPAENIMLHQRITDRYLIDLAKSIAN